MILDDFRWAINLAPAWMVSLNKNPGAGSQVEGYLGSLGDLNHSHPFVQQQMLKFVTGLVEDCYLCRMGIPNWYGIHDLTQSTNRNEDYAVDAFRLDTVVYVDLKFVKEVQQVAWIAGKIEVAGASKSGCIRLSDFIMIGDVAWCWWWTQMYPTINVSCCGL